MSCARPHGVAPRFTTDQYDTGDATVAGAGAAGAATAAVGAAAGGGVGDDAQAARRRGRAVKEERCAR
jgi:hypothetical protein